MRHNAPLARQLPQKVLVRLALTFSFVLLCGGFLYIFLLPWYENYLAGQIQNSLKELDLPAGSSVNANGVKLSFMEGRLDIEKFELTVPLVSEKNGITWVSVSAASIHVSGIDRGMLWKLFSPFASDKGHPGILAGEYEKAPLIANTVEVASLLLLSGHETSVPALFPDKAGGVDSSSGFKPSLFADIERAKRRDENFVKDPSLLALGAESLILTNIRGDLPFLVKEWENPTGQWASIIPSFGCGQVHLGKVFSFAGSEIVPDEIKTLLGGYIPGRLDEANKAQGADPVFARSGKNSMGEGFYIDGKRAKGDVLSVFSRKATAAFFMQSCLVKDVTVLGCSSLEIADVSFWGNDKGVAAAQKISSGKLRVNRLLARLQENMAMLMPPFGVENLTIQDAVVILPDRSGAGRPSMADSYETLRLKNAQLSVSYPLAMARFALNFDDLSIPPGLLGKGESEPATGELQNPQGQPFLFSGGVFFDLVPNFKLLTAVHVENVVLSLVEKRLGSASVKTEFTLNIADISKKWQSRQVSYDKKVQLLLGNIFLKKIDMKLVDSGFSDVALNFFTVEKPLEFKRKIAEYVRENSLRTGEHHAFYDDIGNFIEHEGTLLIQGVFDQPFALCRFIEGIEAETAIHSTYGRAGN